jgi:hypothetical protein
LASLLPEQIPPQAVPITGQDGKATTGWWLFFYNLAQNILGDASGGTSESQVIAGRIFSGHCDC